MLHKAVKDHTLDSLNLFPADREAHTFSTTHVELGLMWGKSQISLLFLIVSGVLAALANIDGVISFVLIKCQKWKSKTQRDFSLIKSVDNMWP